MIVMLTGELNAPEGTETDIGPDGERTVTVPPFVPTGINTFPESALGPSGPLSSFFPQEETHIDNAITTAITADNLQTAPAEAVFFASLLGIFIFLSSCF